MEKLWTVEETKEEFLRETGEPSVTTIVNRTAGWTDETEEKVEAGCGEETEEEGKDVEEKEEKEAGFGLGTDEEQKEAEEENQEEDTKTKKCLGHWESEVRIFSPAF